MEDTTEDLTLREEPVLVGNSVRFVAGAALFAQDGTRAGSLCVLDTRPRQVT